MKDRVDLDALDKLLKSAGEAQVLYHKREITLDEKMERQAAARVALIYAYPAMAKELRELRGEALPPARKIVARSTTRRIDPKEVAKALGAELVPEGERPASIGMARRIP